MKSDEEHLLLCLEDLKPITDQISAYWSGNNQVQTPNINAFTAVLVLVAEYCECSNTSTHSGCWRRNGPGGEPPPPAKARRRRRSRGGGGGAERSRGAWCLTLRIKMKQQEEEVLCVCCLQLSLLHLYTVSGARTNQSGRFRLGGAVNGLLRSNELAELIGYFHTQRRNFRAAVNSAHKVWTSGLI